MPTRETVLTYDKDRDLALKGGDKIRKIHCDLSRICEVEDSVCEWYDIRYLRETKPDFDLTPLLAHFKIVSFETASADGIMCKIHVKAITPGK